jgi:hypothetical protein
MTAQRLLPVLGIETRDIETQADVESRAAAIARLLRFHPVFWPRTYVDLRIEVLDDRRVRFSFGPSPVLDEADGFTWFAQLGGASDRALDAIVQAVDPRAACHAVVPTGDERFAYEAVVDPDAAPAAEAPEIALAKISGGAAFVFTPRRPVRV